MLNSHQLEIVQKLISLLKPIEEVTKMISTNSACISVVIPLVRILERTLNRHHDDAGITQCGKISTENISLIINFKVKYFRGYTASSKYFYHELISLAIISRRLFTLSCGKNCISSYVLHIKYVYQIMLCLPCSQCSLYTSWLFELAQLSYMTLSYSRLSIRDYKHLHGDSPGT